MEDYIYSASDGSRMTTEDVIGWMKAFREINPKYSNWDFDQITGGASEFVSLSDYFELKDIFENYVR